ncbi:MAG TPA: motility protein A [Spirochaetota bacterium]|nr:motility protein A [Spirochaetota bacterium]HNT09331.1 motility protein A [Spirochaetota bacterium]HNV45531.1 motility protein A [Spirochaetota bacterium]HOS39155.1 motility protein A [Spirochaetota bacterium]HPU87185.1 motility protein A [Spirochaetota bacterium]
MSLTYILGVTFGMVTLVFGIFSAGGNLLMFADLPSVFITVGGSIASLMVGYPLVRLLKIKDLFRICLFDSKFNYSELILTLVSFSEKSRREGLLALEDDLQDLNDPFMKMGIQLVVDGNDPELVRKILEIEIDQMAQRHDSYKRMFDDWATLAPSFGMIGTLMGLVMMLVNLQDKSTIGPYLAVALLTTLYGAVMCYVLFTPMATKLDMKTQEEVIVKMITLEGILSIQSGENPRIVKDKLVMYLPPSEREAISREVE